MTALLLGMQASGNLKCVDCVEARMQDTLRGAIIGFVTSAFLLSMMILPGVFTVAKNRFSLRHTRG